MLKYGCNGVSWWKNADIDMMESSWSAWLGGQLLFLFLHPFCLTANLRTREKTGLQKMVKDRRKGKCDCWSPRRILNIGS